MIVTSKRIITTMVLAGPVLFVFFLLDDASFVSFMHGMTLLMAAMVTYEWVVLCGVRTPSGILACMISTMAIIALVVWAVPTTPGIIPIMVGLWCATAIVWIVTFPKGEYLWKYLPVRLLTGLFSITSATAAFIWILQLPNGRSTVLYLLLLVWNIDIGAFFIGQRFGKRRLAPHISPKKTVEGALGGMAFGMISATLCGWALSISPESWPAYLAFSLLLGLACILGDLWESAIKRLAKVKDSSKLLPGHGGFLDRMDAIMTAAPFLSLGIWAGLWP